ncbi:MAG: DUF4147 domain-containing protein [Candidatus Brennerbacteria bacterium]|nr:DUF4147 domain-containing protein [Candidatus Brennerbacteria bacterium]
MVEGKILNAGTLATTPLRRAALSIAEAGLSAIDTKTAIRTWVRLEDDLLVVRDQRVPLDPAGKFVVVTIGKCALAAARVLEEVFRDKIDDGVVLAPRPLGDSKIGSGKLKIFFGSHPFPTRANMEGTHAIVDFLNGLSERDTVLFVISGGGSTLLCDPARDSCEDETNMLRHFFAAGVDIREINTLRKHLSRARGGWLARVAYPAQVVSLVFSDVAGDDLGSIASGPTVRDTTSVTDAETILEKYNLPNLVLTETPKEEKYFARVLNTLFLSNADALQAMAARAEREGFTSRVVTSALAGEASAAGTMIAEKIRAAHSETALLYGGETTVTLLQTHREQVRGRGGRNMELALAALPNLKEGELVLALASDGRDNSDFAGALCDTITMTRAEEKGTDPQAHLAAHNSYRFFEQTGDALRTGDTGSNVADLVVALKE